jgi:hypothetical protein
VGAGAVLWWNSLLRPASQASNSAMVNSSIGTGLRQVSVLHFSTMPSTTDRATERAVVEHKAQSHFGGFALVSHLLCGRYPDAHMSTFSTQRAAALAFTSARGSKLFVSKMTVVFGKSFNRTRKCGLPDGLNRRDSWCVAQLCRSPLF